MHSGFAAAPPQVREAVARWLRSGRRAPRAGQDLDRWIDEVLVPSFTPERAARVVCSGDHHDLGALADAVLLEHLPPRLLPADRRPQVTWGSRRRSGARRSLQLGSYDALHGLVRVHRVLDQPAVPAFFVRYVLFHELLHAALPPRLNRARMVHHGPAFRRIERAYPDYQRAKTWEEQNIHRLIRSARTGRPMRRLRRATLRAVQRLLFD